METKVLRADTEAIREAAEIIKNGGLVGFPTETVYGLGADGLNQEAVLRIFAAKERPADNPLILHIARFEDLVPLVREITPVARALTNAFWPGPLTVLLDAKPIVPEAVHPGLDTVTVRMPSHPVAARLILEAGTPIAAPSANRSGRPSPTRAEDVYTDMIGRIPLILDGGSCGVGVESTVVDCRGEVPKILRPGGITAEMVESVCGAVSVDASALAPLAPGVKAASPGMMYKHYAPKTPLVVVEGEPAAQLAKMRELYDAEAAAGKSPILLGAAEDETAWEGRRSLVWGRLETPETFAEELFSSLRDLDTMNATLGIVRAVPVSGIGLAVMNRLLRAAAHQVIHA